MEPFIGTGKTEFIAINLAKGFKVLQIKSCDHMFHKSCLSEWFTHNAEHLVCPVCKASIPKATESSIE